MLSQDQLRQQITDSIVDALKNGSLAPWKKPWVDDSNAPGLHTSFASGSAYRGINQIILQVASMKYGFQSKWWATYQSIAFSGASVRRGQKATKIILWKPIRRNRTDVTGQKIDDSFLIMREFSVFNVEQTTGLKEFCVGYSKPNSMAETRYENAEKVIAATGADVRHGGNKAFYHTEQDYIQLPYRHQFLNANEYLQTAFHEQIHWTEHPTRRNFQRDGKLENYAEAELIAEIGSSFLLSELGIPTNAENNYAYLENWLTGLRNDTRFIFRASAQASKAVDFILSFSRNEVPVVPTNTEVIPF